MTRSSERFMKRLAQLVAESSEADWKYAAERLDELSEIARSLSAIASTKRPRQKKSSATSAKRPAKKPLSEQSYSTQVFKLANYLRAHPEMVSLPRLRMMAAIAGVKSDLPSTKSSAVDLIAQHLDILPDPVQLDRINHIMVYLHREGADQSEEFKRWVSLITKRDST